MQTTTHKDLQDSGLHNTPFFTTKHLYLDKLDVEDIGWNRELHKQDCFDDYDITDLSEGEIEDIVCEDFYNTASIYNYYRQVEECNYNEEDAYKCNLIPFNYFDGKEGKDICLLALGGCGTDLTPKLDAYFFLQTGKMDPASMYFRQKDYFKCLVSSEIFNAIEDKFGGVTI